MKKKVKIFRIVVLILIAGAELHGQEYFNAAPVEINTKGKELAPAFFGNDLVFCSDRRSELFIKYTDMNENPLTDLYIAKRRNNGSFANPQLFSKELASKFFEGPATFSSDGKTVYFTRNIENSYDRKEQPLMTFGIFNSKLVNGRWSDPVPFEFNSNSFNTGYPSLSADGTAMLFCSDDPEGNGGFDIYITRMKNGRWSNPENLGKTVNTDKNEVFPFIHPDGRVYFSSRGHNERGDLDIYYTLENKGVWLPPVALGEPFNSSSDDYGLIMNLTTDTAFFVTDRLSSPDIFMASLALPDFTECNPQEENNYCYVFYESNNAEVDTASFAYEWDFGDGSKERALKAEHCYENPGTYQIELNVIDKVTGEKYFSQANYFLEVEKIEQPYITVKEKAEEGEELVFDASESYYKGYEIGNYYWNFGDGDRSVSVNATHAYRIPGTYTITLGVTGSNIDGTILKECASYTIEITEKQ